MRKMVFVCVLCFLNQLILSAFMCPTAAGQNPGWGTPELVEKNQAGDSHGPDVASDGAGNALAVWTQFDGNDDHIWANRYVPGVGWGPVQLIETEKFGNVYLPGPASDAHVAMNAGGKGVAVWEKGERGSGRLRAYENVYNVGSGWGAGGAMGMCVGDASGPRVAIGPSGVAMAVWMERSGSWDTICSSGSPPLVVTGVAGYALYPEVGVDSLGNAVAVWQQTGGMYDDIYAGTYTSGSGWSTPQLIKTNSTGSAWIPKLAVEPGGNATAVWEQSSNIWANRYVHGIGWGTAELIGHGAYGPQVAADAGGNVIAVWAQYDGLIFSIWADRYVSGVGWGTAEQIETNNLGDAEYPEVSIDGNGNAVAVWNESDGTRGSVWANRYVVGAGWGTAQLIETNDSGDVLLPQVAVDLAGDAVVVWEQRGGPRSDIWANRYAVGVGWGVPVLVETDQPRDAVHPQVAVDSGGNALAVWEQDNGGIINAWANMYIPGVGWGTDELIEGDNWGDVVSPQIAIDTNGNAMVVWHQYDYMMFGSYMIRASRYAVGVGWTSWMPGEISSSGNAFNPQVAIDASGNATVVWQQKFSRSSIYANRYVVGTGWGTAQQIEIDDSGNSQDAQVAVDPAGNAVAVWQRTDGIWGNRYVAGVGWGTAGWIGAATSGAKNPQVAIDASGNAVAVWQQYQGAIYGIWANRYLVGVGWGAPELIETSSTGDAQYPQVAIDASGNAVAVWQQSQGARNDIWANRYAVGVGWGTAGLVETDDLVSADSPQVAVNPAGNVMAVWHQFDGTGKIYGNRYVVGRGWGTPELAENSPGDALNPQVALSPSGNATVVWQQSDGSGYRIWGNGYVASDELSPIANAGPDQSVEEGTLVTFDGSASTDNVGIVNYTWTFFDGGMRTLFSMSPTYTFNSAGSFTVALVVKDAAGNYGMDFVVITVNPPPDTQNPAADAGPDRTIDVGSTIVLDGSASTDNVGIVNYTWTFVDGSTRTLYGVFPTYTFNNVGMFIVTLTVKDAAANSDLDIVVITVIPPPDTQAPIADAGPAQSVAAGTLVTFDGSGSTDNFGIVNYTWSFDDGGARIICGVAPAFRFNVAGTFVVTLIVKDAAGNDDSDQVVITVTPSPDTQPPVANAGPDRSILVGTTIVLDGSASTDNVGVVNYTWSFDDGGAKFRYVAMWAYQFNNTGVFTITLAVRDAAGNIASDTAVITVNPPASDTEAPVAEAGPDQSILAGSATILDGSGSTDNVGIVNYSWTFIYDGATRTLYGQLAAFKFDVTGDYTVTLTVRDAAGNSDTDTVVMTATAAPGGGVTEKEVTSPLAVVAIVLLAILVVVFALMLILARRKKKGGKSIREEETEMEEGTAPEESIEEET